jgi:lipopolysaccharide export system protein LptA
MIRAAVLLLMLLAGSAGAEETSNLPQKDIKLEGPIQVTSKKMMVNNQEKIMVFDGEVNVVKGDLLMTSDHVKIHFRNKSMSAGQQEISVIEADGNVQVTRGSRHAKSEHAEYRQGDETVVLTGSPEGWDNQYRVSGTKMTIFLKEDRSIVEGSRVLFNPQNQGP